MEGVEEQPRSNEEAFQRYVVPEVEVLLRVAMSLTRHHADAEDLVQDTMLRAYKAIGRFDGRHPRAWLLTIMRNSRINTTRRKRPELLRDLDGGQRRLENQDPSASAEDAAVGEVFDATVEAAFEALPEKFRRVVELVDVDGLTYQEAADALGVPVGTVMSRLHRARRRIRSRLHAAGVVPRSNR